MKKLIFSCIALVLICLSASAVPGDYVKFGTTDGGRSVTAEFLSPYIIKITNTPMGQVPPQAQSVLEIEGLANFEIPTLSVDIDSNGVITIQDSVNGIWLRDCGARRVGNNSYQIELQTNSQGSFYGGGERGHKVNLRGDTLVNYNQPAYGYSGSDPRAKQLNITMPLVLSSDGYALLFDDFAASTLQLGDTIRYTTEAPVPISYYYIGGVSTMSELSEQVAQLIGYQPLPPLWMLGYVNSKYGYKSPEETIAVVDSLKNLGYPLDATVLDLYWFGKEEDMGILDWDRTNWADPAAMIDSLDARNVKLITVSEPFVLKNGRAIDTYNVLDAGRVLLRDSVGNTHPVTIWVGDGGLFDMSNPGMRQWLKNRYRKLTDYGVSGWWGDLGEPEKHPETGWHANGLTARQYHNRYGNDWASILSELYAETYPATRQMTLMRGGTIGLQRYSVFPWSGDVARSWDGMEPQVRIMLHSGLCGLAYMSSDLGGFAVDPENPFQPELYLRWLQMGLFNPVFRTHAQQYAEPFNYPMYQEELQQLVRERYRWLPYNYTLAYENATKGWPLVRPIDFNIESNGEYDDVYSTEYLWGNDVLVAPVFNEGQRSRTVRFPAGSNWIDAYDTSKIYVGGTDATVPAPLNQIPHFYRAGSIIPTADYPMENTTGYYSDLFTINYYPGPATVYTLYDDNHLSPTSLQMEAYRLIEFSSDTDENGVCSISVYSNGTYPGAPETVTLHFRINCMDAPASVLINGTATEALYDAQNRVVLFVLNYRPETNADIVIIPNL